MDKEYLLDDGNILLIKDGKIIEKNNGIIIKKRKIISIIKKNKKSSKKQFNFDTYDSEKFSLNEITDESMQVDININEPDTNIKSLY